MAVRRKCFISYHHADQEAVTRFVDTFDHGHNLFIVRRLGEMPDDLINSNNTEYVMGRIRADYISDSTVTIVLAGKCTWARRYVDWEIQASLRSGDSYTPNGLLGIKLPTFSQWPERFRVNNQANNDDSHYAGFINYPTSTDVLVNAIEWAYDRRFTHANRIKNTRERFEYNRTCS